MSAHNRNSDPLMPKVVTFCSEFEIDSSSQIGERISLRLDGGSLSIIWRQASVTMDIATPLSLWMQLMSLWFFVSGFFSDLLVVRSCLVTAYVFLLLNALLGGPMWPALFVSDGPLSLDAIFWAFVNLWVHGTSLVHLWLDERPVEMSEHMESLWRLFYRTGGISRKVFAHTIAKHVSVVEYKETTEIPIKNHFYIVYQGTVELHSSTVGRRKDVSVCSTISSGQMFDYRILALLHEDDDHVKDTILKKAVVTGRSVTLFAFPKHEMADIIRSQKTVWLQLVTQVLGRMSSKLFSDAESQLFLRDYLHQYFAPLREWELPQPLAPGSGHASQQPLAHVLYTMVNSFSPPWPMQNHFVGLRHRLAPPEKVLEEIPGKLLDTKGTGLETLYRNRWGTAETVSFSESASLDELSASFSQDEDDKRNALTGQYDGTNQGSRNLVVGYGSTTVGI